jgi:hypothetical protein
LLYKRAVIPDQESARSRKCDNTFLIWYKVRLLTDVTWNPHLPTPSPTGEGEQNPYFLVPLSCGREARGEGFTIFHVI